MDKMTLYTFLGTILLSGFGFVFKPGLLKPFLALVLKTFGVVMGNKLTNMLGKAFYRVGFYTYTYSKDCQKTELINKDIEKLLDKL